MFVSEVFASLQGEGALAGVPSFFIRTSGCNLRCRWCDTPYTSWRPEGRRSSVTELVRSAHEARVHHVVVTGGEPLLQRQIGELTSALADRGFHITVETAGTVSPPFVCDLLSLSPKTAGSDPHGRWRLRHRRVRSSLAPMRRLLERFTEVQLKFVVESPDDIQDVHDTLDRLPPVEPWRVQLMPEGTTASEVASKARMVAALCAEHGFRYTPRLHLDLFGGGRGV